MENNFKYKWKLQFKNPVNAEYTRWFVFYNKIDFVDFRLSLSSYYDPRPQIHFQITHILAWVLLFLIPVKFVILLLPLFFLGWGTVYIKLPLHSGIEDEAEYQDYGYYFYGESNKYLPHAFVINAGNWSKYINLPWSFEWYRTSILLKDMTWCHEYSRKTKLFDGNKYFFEEGWLDKKYMFKKDLTYKVSEDNIQTCVVTVTVGKREWRRKWLYKFPWFNFVRHYLELEFSEEMGSRRGRWKGGTVGMRWDIKKGLNYEEAFEDFAKNVNFR